MVLDGAKISRDTIQKILLEETCLRCNNEYFYPYMEMNTYQISVLQDFYVRFFHFYHAYMVITSNVFIVILLHVLYNDFPISKLIPSDQIFNDTTYTPNKILLKDGMAWLQSNFQNWSAKINQNGNVRRTGIQMNNINP